MDRWSFEYPPGATAGSLIDWWDRPIADVGVPGLDGGHGAVVTIVGPGQDMRAVSQRAHVLHSRTLNTALFSRFLDGGSQNARELLAGLHIYPHDKRAHVRTRLLRFKSQGDLTSLAHPRGLAYWKRLASALRNEPVEERDRFFAAMLKPLGIEKGQPFHPDSRQTKILTEAAVVGEAMAKASSFNKRSAGTRYRPDAHWEYFIPPSFVVDQDVPNGTQFEERTTFFYEVMGASKGVMSKTPGVGSGYLSAYHDKDGRALDGAKTYRLRVSPNAPAKLFWSVTLYDVETRCLVQNKERIADRSSRADLQKKRRRLDRYIHGSSGPRRPGKELDPNGIRKGMVYVFPFVRSARTVF